jgi:hypothetical protein
LKLSDGNFLYQKKISKDTSTKSESLFFSMSFCNITQYAQLVHYLSNDAQGRKGYVTAKCVKAHRPCLRTITFLTSLKLRMIIFINFLIKDLSPERSKERLLLATYASRSGYNCLLGIFCTKKTKTFVLQNESTSYSS